MVGSASKSYLDNPQVRVVIGIENRRHILRSCHSEPLAGHFGVTKRWHRISERYYWKGLYQDIVDMVTT